MARATVLGRLSWRPGEVVAAWDETPTVRSLVLYVDGWPGHEAGQHVDLRVTADDGYQALRSYSIASAPEQDTLVVTVERIDDGEVSPYLVEEMDVGDQCEVRGPIGGYFVWHHGLGGPLLLVAGGSGVVPLMAMLRHHRASGAAVPVRLLYSARSLDEVIYREELDRLGAQPEVDVIYTLTRQQPPGWAGHRRRVDAELLAEVAWPAADRPAAYVCGPTGFVETVARSLVELGHDPDTIRTERFGPTGS
ncbi:MAG: ferredoxin reductase [Acidimicrobiales bacterium]